jgi:integrase
MGSVFRRGDSPFLWMKWKNAQGKWCSASTQTVDELKARAVLAAVEKAVALEKPQGEDDESGPLTVTRYGRQWLKRRQKSGLHSVRDDIGRFTKWVAPSSLGSMLLAEVKPTHVRDFVRQLEAFRDEEGEPLAPRTVRNVYGVLRVLFADAVAEELVPSSPCVLLVRRKELPKKRDKDANWRSGAVFTREEVATLLTDARLRPERRVLYAILFLSGLRFGEAADRRWQDYDATATPLGRLTVASSFNVRTKKAKETKTGHATPRAGPPGACGHPCHLAPVGLVRPFGPAARGGGLAHPQQPWRRPARQQRPPPLSPGLRHGGHSSPTAARRPAHLRQPVSGGWGQPGPFAARHA